MEKKTLKKTTKKKTFHYFKISIFVLITDITHTFLTLHLYFVTFIRLYHLSLFVCLFICICSRARNLDFFGRDNYCTPPRAISYLGNKIRLNLNNQFKLTDTCVPRHFLESNSSRKAERCMSALGCTSLNKCQGSLVTLMATG